MPDGSPCERTGLVWYPSREAAREHNYRFQRGIVALDATVSPGKHPLILFSHGYLGSADQVVFLTEALARAGYIVAAVNHTDSLTQRRVTPPLESPKFGDPRSWTDRKFADRGIDMRSLLDRVLAENDDPASFLHDHIDARAVGIMGHSLGGYTALGLSGGWPSWRDERLRAALLLSPYSQPFLGRLAPSAVAIPTMIQGGTLDTAITPLLPPIFDALPAPKFLLVLKMQTHFAWTNLLSLGTTTVNCLEVPGPAKLIVDYSIAFFDRTLRGRDPAILKAPNDALELWRAAGE